MHWERSTVVLTTRAGCAIVPDGKNNERLPRGARPVRNHCWKSGHERSIDHLMSTASDRAISLLGSKQLWDPCL